MKPKDSPTQSVIKAENETKYAIVQLCVGMSKKMCAEYSTISHCRAWHLGKIYQLQVNWGPSSLVIKTQLNFGFRPGDQSNPIHEQSGGAESRRGNVCLTKGTDSS